MTQGSSRSPADGFQAVRNVTATHEGCAMRERRLVGGTVAKIGPIPLLAGECTLLRTLLDKAPVAQRRDLRRMVALARWRARRVGEKVVVELLAPVAVGKDRFTFKIEASEEIDAIGTRSAERVLWSWRHRCRARTCRLVEETLVEDGFARMPRDVADAIRDHGAVSGDMCAAVAHVLKRRSGEETPRPSTEMKLLVDLEEFADALSAREVTDEWHTALTRRLMRVAQRDPELRDLVTRVAEEVDMRSQGSS